MDVVGFEVFYVVLIFLIFCFWWLLWRFNCDVVVVCVVICRI